MILNVKKLKWWNLMKFYEYVKRNELHDAIYFSKIQGGEING